MQGCCCCFWPHSGYHKHLESVRWEFCFWQCQQSSHPRWTRQRGGFGRVWGRYRAARWSSSGRACGPKIWFASSQGEKGGSSLHSYIRWHQSVPLQTQSAAFMPYVAHHIEEKSCIFRIIGLLSGMPICISLQALAVEMLRYLIHTCCESLARSRA